MKTIELTGLILIFALFASLSKAQTNMLTYAGNEGSEAFYDVAQLSNGNILVLGAASDLDWIAPEAPRVELSAGDIQNNAGTQKIAFILLLDSTAQQLLSVYHLPKGAAENFRFIKFSNMQAQSTEGIYISGDTEDSATGGYFIGKLNHNFIDGVPTGFDFIITVKAKTGSYPKIYHPWDVGSDGKVVYAYGDSHDYNWSAVYRQKADGTDDLVPNWRIHWTTSGTEFYGAADEYPGPLADLSFSGIVFKRDGQRCELRSHTQDDYDFWQPDGNGGMKKGKWPLDVLFDAPCVPQGSSNTTSGPGYTGYSPGATFTYGPSAICIDRRNDHIYIGFNAKSVTPSGQPDFEPAVMAMDDSGEMKWWSRLYHEVRPDGDTLISEPDQYIDALAIDYSKPPENGYLVVGARCHGNNVENLWEGNSIAANPSSWGFQNNFTGTNGNIHLSWLGKLSLASGDLFHSTYMGELAEGAASLGTPHTDPNLDGWPDPNTGWPDLNSTFLIKNMMKTGAEGNVIVLAKGRRTITTANAYQKMVKPYYGGKSCWNDFVRVYDSTLGKPIYSSLVVGQWDTLTQANGDNVRLFGVFKTARGLLVVGQHTGSGNNIPVANVPTWGASEFDNESAVLAYFQTDNLLNWDDEPGAGDNSTRTEAYFTADLDVFPNPALNTVWVDTGTKPGMVRIEITDLFGRVWLEHSSSTGTTQIDISRLLPGSYIIRGWDNQSQPIGRQILVVVK